MSKIDSIECFLELMTDISKNSIEITPNLVYANLTTYGIQKKEKINIFFEQWINRYKSNRNINVFNDENWKYFCQFKSRKNNEQAYNRIKLYVSLDKDHIYTGANKIFDFLTTNNIDHISKIGSDTRIDDIVIRLNNPNDAEKVKRFIESDAYIREGIIKPNDFAFNDGIVALAWDGNMSYNDIVSKWISDYINSLKRTNQLSNVSYNGFYKFILQKYKDLFVEGNNIKQFANEKGLDKDNWETILKIANYADITKMILTALDPNKNFKNYFEGWKVITSNKYQKDNCEKMKLLYEKEKSSALEQKGERQQNNAQHYIDNNTKFILDCAFEKMQLAYGEKQTLDAFENFSSTENYNYITRQNGAREILIKNKITKGIVREYLEEKKIDIIDAAIFETYQKYGERQTKNAIHNATLNFYSNFTNSNGNNRNKLQQYVPPTQFNNLLRNSLIREGYQIEDINENLYEFYYNKVIKIGKERTA